MITVACGWLGGWLGGYTVSWLGGRLVRLSVVVVGLGA